MLLLAGLFLLCAMPREGRAVAERERAAAGGYFRIMTRPDLQGGGGKLGLWNLNGRLLNEGPWGALELRLDLLPQAAGRTEVWSSVHTKIEGGSFWGTDPANGRLDQFRVSQLYVLAGNLLLDRVVWQLGTLDSYFGDLSLYDLKPAQIFFETVGLSGRLRHGGLELLVGVGDSGYVLRGDRYSTILTTGGTLRYLFSSQLELGVGGQYLYEPAVAGNRFAPHRTPGVTYEDFVRGEVVERHFDTPRGPTELFLKPQPTSSSSFKLIGYLGFGDLGPLRWNNLFVNYLRRHPESFVTESFGGRTYAVYVEELTDERFELNVGNEAQLTLVPSRLDLAWALLYGRLVNRDNTRFAGEDNREIASTVLRLQGYLTSTVHLLVESSLAREVSKNGRLFREHVDSIFENDGGVASRRGFEFGDTDTRTTWQLKLGPVLNPRGLGIFNRPSLRLLYGLQRSNVHAAYASSFTESLDAFDPFAATEDRHWHSVIALEAEAWF